MAAKKHNAAALRSLPVVLANFLDARCVLECGLMCLENRPDGSASGEAVCIRHALELLASVYEDLDLAICRARL